jgi:hypothetical protein
MDTKSDTQKKTSTWTRMALVLVLGLSSTACQMPGGGGLASAAAGPKSPIGSLVGQTLGKGGNGSLLGTKAGSKVPLGPSTKLPPPPPKKPADRMDFVGDVGRAALGAAGKSGGGIGVSKDQMGLNAKNPEVGPAAAAKGKTPAKTSSSWWPF